VIHHLIEAIRKDVAALDGEVPKDAGLLDLALALDELRTAKAELDMVERDLQGAVVRAMGDRWEATIDGFGGIKVHGGKKRSKWRSDELWPLTLRRARSLIDEPPSSEGEQLLSIVRSAVQPAYWRSTELKRWGVDPDEYCEVTWGRKTVELVK
jgi:hypothetical protein